MTGSGEPEAEIIPTLKDFMPPPPPLCLRHTDARHGDLLEEMR